MLMKLHLPQTLKVRLMLVVGCCAILGTSAYYPPVVEDAFSLPLSDHALVVRVRLNAAAREQAGQWSINVTISSFETSRARIIPVLGPLGTAEEATLDIARLTPQTNAAGFAAVADDDDDAGAAGSFGPQQQPLRHSAVFQLFPAVTECPPGPCEVEFHVERADAYAGEVTLTVHSSATRPFERGCFGDTAPEFSDDAELEVTIQ